MGERYEFGASDLRYGACVGGPMDGKMLAHHAPVYRVAINGSRLMPGIQSSADPDIKFGQYTFEEGKWHWKPPVEVSSPG